MVDSESGLEVGGGIVNLAISTSPIATIDVKLRELLMGRIT